MTENVEVELSSRGGCVSLTVQLVLAVIQENSHVILRNAVRFCSNIYILNFVDVKG